MTDAIDQLFPAHLQHVQALADRALEREGYDGLVVYSGRPGLHFLDDHGPAFKANPHFLHWAPLQEAPDCFVRYLPGPPAAAGAFTSPPTTGTSRRRCRPRPGPREFDLDRDPRARPTRAVCSTPATAAWPSSASCPPSSPSGASARRTRPVCWRTCITTARPRRRTSSRACARRRGSARSRSRCGARRPTVRAPRSSRCTWPTARRSACASRNCPTATSSRSARARRSCTTRRSAAGATCRARTFLIDAGAQFRGYASDITRTHVADAAGIDPTFLELMAAMDAAAARAVRRRATRASTTARFTCSRIA